MARTYKRDSRGRFAGGGGSSSRGGGRKPMQRGTNRLTRDNAGRITSVGGDGATARGGRLRTASGKQRATVTAKGIGKAPAGTVGRSGKVKGAARVKATVRRGDTAAVNIPMRGSRGRALDREISRNVTQQRTQARAADRARNRQFKTEQSRAKALRTVHVGSIAKAKGLTKSQVESALKAQSPAVQIKALKSWVRDNRKTARMAANAARTQERSAAKPAAAAKPARRRAAVGKISEAKANRIVARIDANRPGRRAANGSVRRTQNAIRTHRKASDFTLAAAARARRSGKSITVAQSLQRAVSNAAKRRR